jgi:uncharacterized membrane protein YesL
MGRVLKATYDELFLCVMMSLLWWLGQALIITAAPATMGMNGAVNRMANYKRTGSEFFWEHAKKNFGRGWLMYLLLIAVPLLVAFNIWFYSYAEGWLRMAAFLWVWVLLLALMVGQYLFPLFQQQDEPSVKLALRNAAILALRYPLYTILLLLFQAVLLGISFVLVLPLVLFAPAMLSLTGNFGMAGILQEMGLAPEPPETPKRGR